MSTLAEEKLKQILKRRFPDLKLSQKDFEECKQSLIHLGKAICISSFKKGDSNE
jgi:hypothetical protein